MRASFLTKKSPCRRAVVAGDRPARTLAAPQPLDNTAVMSPRLFALLIIVAVMFGASQASALLFAFMGPWTAVGVQHDGSAMHMAFGQNLPRPGWIPVYPGATVVQTSLATSPQMPSGVGTLQIGTRAAFDEVRTFYRDHLTAAGFDVTDRGVAPLNPATAALLGIRSEERRVGKECGARREALQQKEEK